MSTDKDGKPVSRYVALLQDASELGLTTYEWLKDNAYKYGFILRYPEGKENITGFAFESWHYRYVGKDIAKIIYDNDLTYEEYYAYYIEK